MENIDPQDLELMEHKAPQASELKAIEEDLPEVPDYSARPRPAKHDRHWKPGEREEAKKDILNGLPPETWCDRYSKSVGTYYLIRASLQKTGRLAEHAKAQAALKKAQKVHDQNKVLYLGWTEEQVQQFLYDEEIAELPLEDVLSKYNVSIDQYDQLWQDIDAERTECYMDRLLKRSGVHYQLTPNNHEKRT